MDTEVQIVKLPTMRVAAFHGFGQEPETEALDKMRAWATPRGYADRAGGRRAFGFNDPDPSAESTEYGYQVWLTLGPDEKADGDAQAEEFSGGLYAVLRCPVQGDPAAAIPTAWERLSAWREGSAYGLSQHQWLEEHLDWTESPGGAFTLDLYLPIAE